MKRLILLSLFGLSIMSLTTAAYAQEVVVPSSSIQRPEDVGQRFHTNVRWLAQPPFAPALPPVSGLFYETPASLGCIYKLVSPRVPGCNPNIVTVNPTGGSKAIAIVDAYDAPYAASDLQTFSTQFGLPFSPSQFQVVYASGSPPAYDAGWEMEELLDIEWAHAMAPNATIYLVEAASNLTTDLMTAVGVAGTLVAAAGGGEVSMSWSGSEFFGEDSYDSNFQTPGIVYFAATGDSPGTSYLSTSPYIVAVGGTTLRTNAVTGNFEQEVAWVDAGGGLSPVEPRPSYQNGIKGKVGNYRGVPDISAIADLNTGVYVYNSNQGGWFIVGGTSVATPVLAGIVNKAGHFYQSTFTELKKVYSAALLSIGYFDITYGFCGPYMGNRPRTGWDFCTGVGSPRTYGGK